MLQKEITRLTLLELKDKLRELGLSLQGRKQQLQNRLLTHFGIDNLNESVYEDSVAENLEDTVGPVITNTMTFTLKDIQDSLADFDGSNESNANNWLTDFESIAVTVQWNDLQKFIYGRQLLKGAAKLFVNSQDGITNWATLKEALAEEFTVKLTDKQIHKQLENRKKNQNESLIEYYYTMKGIAKKSNLDEESIIEYIIEGIQDSKHNKMVLYQANDLKELKEKLNVYAKMSASVENKPKVKQEKTESSGSAKKEFRCYKCGDKDHLARNCGKEPVCFKCHKPGHKANQCDATPMKEENSDKKAKANIQQVAQSMFNRVFKDVQIGNQTISAVIDTGSDICTISESSYKKAHPVKLNTDIKELVGIGHSKIYTLGSFVIDTQLDRIPLRICFHVVRDVDTLYNGVIGNDVFEFVDVKMGKNGATFCCKNQELSDDGIQTDEIALGSEAADLQEALQQMMAVDTFDGNSEIDLAHLLKEDKERVLSLIKSYEPIKPDKSPVEMKIILTDDIPVFHRPRRLSYADQEKVNKQVQDWMVEGIIRNSVSEYASPVVLVSKKDGKHRLCCDYRQLNLKIVRDNFPTALIDDVLHKLQKGNVFTTLDLCNGFFHVPVSKESRKFTSFVTQSGQYEFNFVPFGISNSPAVFMRYIFAVLRPLIEDGTLILYMDDLIIPSIDEKEGLEKLQRVLSLARISGLKIKWAKCQFLMRKVQFLGYIIENSTIKPSKEKTLAVENFPVPGNRKMLQRYLGLTSYFRRFVKDFAVIAKPLTNLMRQNVTFKMGDEQLASFNQLKTCLSNPPLLRLFNPKAVTEIHCDASMHGYGGMLLQKDSEDQSFHPVEYMSRKTSAAEEKYPSYELEVLAIVQALKKWRVYVLGMKITIVTDCNAFAMTLNKKDVPLRVARWAIFLQDFEYTVEHRSGTKMKHVDALSRVYCLLMQDSLRNRIVLAQVSDNWTAVVIKLLEQGVYDDFYMQNGVLCKDPLKELIVIPVSMEKEIITLAHRQGHFGVKKTVDLIEREYFIPQVSEKVGNIVKSCLDCIMSDTKAGRKEGFLNVISKGDKPLTTYHIDHVGPMDLTKKLYNHILVVVDAFSKFVWLYPTKSTGSEEVIDRLQRQAEIFGDPSCIVTDRGTAFTSSSFESYCESNNIKHLLIATGVPRGNGQVERINRIVISLLTKLCAEDSKAWYKSVGRVQQFINSSPPRSTKISPFRILTGLEMRTKYDKQLKDILDEDVLNELQEEKDEVRRVAKENIASIQAENRKAFDKNRTNENEYDINDLVAIKRTQFGPGLKLKKKYLGPYKVVRKLRHGRYAVEKVGEDEGPNKTNTVAEYMKEWRP